MPADIPSRHPISNGRRWLSRSRCLVPSVAVATPCPGRSSGLHKGMSIARFGTRWMPSSNNAGLQISRHFILVAVRLRAYAGTLDSVPWYTAQCTGVRCPTYCCHLAQRTTVILPNVLLYSSPTYWHLDGALSNRRVSVQRLDLRLLNNHALTARTGYCIR